MGFDWAGRGQGSARLQVRGQLGEFFEVFELADANDRDLEQHAGVEAVTHFRHRLIEHLDGGERGFQAEFGAEPFDLGVVGFRSVQQQIEAAPDRHSHDVSEVPEQLLGQLANFDTLMERAFQFGQRGRRIAVDQMGRQLGKPTGPGGAEHLMDIFHGDAAGREREQLFEERLAVAHRAGSAAAQEPQRFLLGFQPFGFHDQPQPVDDRFGGDWRKIEALAA